MGVTTASCRDAVATVRRRNTGSTPLCDHWAEAGSSSLEMTDVQRAIADKKRQRLVEANDWRTEPQDGRQCSGCLYFNSPDKDISYCWNPNLQVEVGHDHWCTHWEQGPAA